jgi:hypothetical protein
MNKNVGMVDRAARFAIGPALVLLGYSRLCGQEGRLSWGLLPLVAGVSMIQSAVTRVCPMSAMLGIDSRTTEEKIRDKNIDVEKDLTSLASFQTRMAALEKLEPQM